MIAARLTLRGRRLAQALQAEPTARLMDAIADLQNTYSAATAARGGTNWISHTMVIVDLVLTDRLGEGWWA